MAGPSLLQRLMLLQVTPLYVADAELDTMRVLMLLLGIE
jgi:hypothetical protein